MKKSIIIISFLFAALTSSAQTKDTTEKQFTDTTKMDLSVKDVIKYTDQMKSYITVAESESFWKVMNYIIQSQATLYNQKKNKK